MPEIKFKKSADFALTVGYVPAEGGLPDLLGYTATAHLEDGAGVSHALTCVMAGDGMSIELTATSQQTDEWRCGSASVDVRLTNGTSVLTDTLVFPIIKNITPLAAS